MHLRVTFIKNSKRFKFWEKTCSKSKIQHRFAFWFLNTQNTRNDFLNTHPLCNHQGPKETFFIIAKNVAQILLQFLYQVPPSNILNLPNRSNACFIFRWKTEFFHLPICKNLLIWKSCTKLNYNKLWWLSEQQIPC